MSSHADRPARQFYGRRRGRPLRARLQSLIETLLPRLDVALPAPGQQLALTSLFEIARPLWLEIGFGGGEHLAWQARRHPDVGFLGAEYFLNGIASLLRHLDDDRLDNVRIYQGDARDLLPHLPDAVVERAFVLFPDPWPKARHNKRRLIQAETLDDLARVMADGAQLRLATDDPGYLQWMLESLMRHPAFRWDARRPSDWRERPPDWPATRYEAKAIRQGRKPAYLSFRRQPR